MRNESFEFVFKPWRIECSTIVQAHFTNSFRCKCIARHATCDGGFTKGGGSYGFPKVGSSFESFKLALWFAESADKASYRTVLFVVLAAAPVLDVSVASEVVPFDSTEFACFDEDNTAVIIIAKKSRPPALRQLCTTHWSSLSWLGEVFQNPDNDIDKPLERLRFYGMLEQLGIS